MSGCCLTRLSVSLLFFHFGLVYFSRNLLGVFLDSCFCLVFVVSPVDFAHYDNFVVASVVIVACNHGTGIFVGRNSQYGVRMYWIATINTILYENRKSGLV